MSSPEPKTNKDEDVASPAPSDDDSKGKQASGQKRSAEDADVQQDDDEGSDSFNARKLEQRRAYNRKCAAKARKRSKDLISHLQGQVEDLTKDKTELQRSNDVMRAQLELLESQNRTLMMSQRQPMAPPQGGGYGGPSPFLMNGMGGGMGAGGYPSGNLQLLDALAAQRGMPPGSMPGAGGMTPGGMGAGTPGAGAPGMDGKFFR